MQTKINLAFADYSRLIRRMGKDHRLSSTHISLCAALFAAWQKSGYVKATYHKCIRELDEHGYIRYQPSFSPKQESLVYWPNLA